jgi:hypothetical protein
MEPTEIDERAFVTLVDQVIDITILSTKTACEIAECRYRRSDTDGFGVRHLAGSP